MVDDISHENLRILLREEGVTCPRLKTWKGSTDPEFAQKKARIERLCAIADGAAEPRDGEPAVVGYFALDGTDHRTHQEQGSMIRRYIAWRNRNVQDQQLRRIVNRANVA